MPQHLSVKVPISPREDRRNCDSFYPSLCHLSKRVTRVAQTSDQGITINFLGCQIVYQKI